MNSVPAPAAMVPNTYDQLHHALSTSRVYAIVGLSDKPHRPSYFVAKYLLDRGFEVIPVNPAHEEILGQKCYANLLDIPRKIDIVDCFRRAEQMPELAQQARRIEARILWMQLSVISPEARDIAEAGGLQVIMDRCVKIEYARIFGGLNWAGVNTGIISAKRRRFINL